MKESKEKNNKEIRRYRIYGKISYWIGIISIIGGILSIIYVTCDYNKIRLFEIIHKRLESLTAEAEFGLYIICAIIVSIAITLGSVALMAELNVDKRLNKEKGSDEEKKIHNKSNKYALIGTISNVIGLGLIVITFILGSLT